MKLSVLMITYNHEPFIARAIESALMQRTDFPYEIVIGEDCSTDGTRAIVADYAARYPDRIRALLPPHNLGLQGLNNMNAALKACRGEYVALLEGDDYWLSPDKLARQVALMEADSEITLSCHNNWVIYEDGSQEPHESNRAATGLIPLEDLISRKFFAATGSILFRRLFSEFPEWFFNSRYEDYTIVLMMATRGRVHYLDEVLGAYRRHAGGMSYALDYDYYEYVDIGILTSLNSYSEYRFDRLIRESIGARFLSLAVKYRRQRQLVPLVTALARALRHTTDKSLANRAAMVYEGLVPERVKLLLGGKGATI